MIIFLQLHYLLVKGLYTIYRYLLDFGFIIIVFLIFSIDYNLKITNVGSIAIDLLEVSIESTIEPTLKNSIIRVDTENIKDYLPILPNSETVLGIHLTGALNFLSNNQYPLAGILLN